MGQFILYTIITFLIGQVGTDLVIPPRVGRRMAFLSAYAEHDFMKKNW